MTQLQGKVAFITGGSKGIGFGIAQVLLQKGIHVAITSRSLESAQKAANQLSVFAADLGNLLLSPSVKKQIPFVFYQEYLRVKQQGLLLVLL